MAKLTRNAVLEMMDEFADISKKIEAADRKKNKDLAVHQKAYNEATKPIQDKFDQKTAPLVDRQHEIQAAVAGWLGQQGKDQILRSEAGAVAEQKTETKIGSRVINVEKFLKAAKSKGAAMWDCVTVAIAKAEKLIGKDAVDEISDKKETTTVSHTLRVE